MQYNLPHIDWIETCYISPDFIHLHASFRNKIRLDDPFIQANHWNLFHWKREANRSYTHSNLTRVIKPSFYWNALRFFCKIDIFYFPSTMKYAFIKMCIKCFNMQLQFVWWYLQVCGILLFTYYFNLCT